MNRAISTDRAPGAAAAAQHPLSLNFGLFCTSLRMHHSDRQKNPWQAKKMKSRSLKNNKNRITR
ncbi:MAG: hypothetical protein ACKPKO_52470 [Candidatus Fonsibacter sp.]